MYVKKLADSFKARIRRLPTVLSNTSRSGCFQSKASEGRGMASRGRVFVEHLHHIPPVHRVYAGAIWLTTFIPMTGFMGIDWAKGVILASGLPTLVLVASMLKTSELHRAIKGMPGTNRIWLIEMDSVLVGTITDMELLEIRLKSYYSKGMALASTLNLTKVTLRMALLTAVGTPILMFWLFCMGFMINPTMMDALLTSAVHSSLENGMFFTHQVLPMMMFITFTLLMMATHLSMPITGYVDQHAKEVSLMIQRHCGQICAGERIRLIDPDGNAHTSPTPKVRSPLGKLLPSWFRRKIASPL